jgi:hypothetical protein
MSGLLQWLFRKEDAFPTDNRVLSQSSRKYDRHASHLAWGNAGDAEAASLRYLMYFVLPAMFVPGVLDWLWHKQTDIEHTAGTKESITHVMMLTEAGLPIVAALFLEPNALLLTLMMAAYVAHEATAAWDLSVTDERKRRVPPA